MKTWEQIYAEMEVDETNPFEVAVAVQARRIYRLCAPSGSQEQLEAFRRMSVAYNQLRSRMTEEALADLRDAIDSLERVTEIQLAFATVR